MAIKGQSIKYTSEDMNAVIRDSERMAEDFTCPPPIRFTGTCTLILDANLIPDRVIFDPPATIVFWKDGTKTVVKCHDDEFDREKGLAMATIRKIYPSRNAFLKVLKGSECPRKR